MLGYTHILTASTIATLPLLNNDFEYVAIYSMVYIGILIGSILPDIDEPHSLIGKRVKFLSYPIKIIFGHRTITHNVFASILISILGVLLNIDIIVGIGIGMFIHILSDSITVNGIKGALFPLTSNSYKFVLLPYSLRFKVGGSIELVLSMVLGLYNIYFFVVIFN